MWISFSTGFPQTDAQQTKPETLLMGTRCRILKTPTLSISMSRFRCWVRSVGFSKIRRSLLFSKHLQFQVKVSDRASIRHKTTSYFMLHFVSGPGLGWTQIGLERNDGWNWIFTRVWNCFDTGAFCVWPTPGLDTYPLSFSTLNLCPFFVLLF